MIRRLLLASLGAFFVIGSGEPAVAQFHPQWQDVDCGAAKLTMTASPLRCRRAPAPFVEGARESCVGEWWEVYTRSPANFGFAHLNSVRGLGQRCSVRFFKPDELERLGLVAPPKELPLSDIGAVLKSMAKDATGWSDVSQIGDIYDASFTSARGQNCKAFVKYGPPWEAGFAWTLNGRLCGAQGKSVSDGDLQSFASSLIVRGQS